MIAPNNYSAERRRLQCVYVINIMGLLFHRLETLFISDLQNETKSFRMVSTLRITENIHEL
jgi:hypothetical protein